MVRSGPIVLRGFRALPVVGGRAELRSGGHVIGNATWVPSNLAALAAIDRSRTGFSVPDLKGLSGLSGLSSADFAFMHKLSTALGQARLIGAPPLLSPDYIAAMQGRISGNVLVEDGGLGLSVAGDSGAGSIGGVSLPVGLSAGSGVFQLEGVNSAQSGDASKILFKGKEVLLAEILKAAHQRGWQSVIPLLGGVTMAGVGGVGLLINYVADGSVFELTYALSASFLSFLISGLFFLAGHLFKDFFALPDIVTANKPKGDLKDEEAVALVRSSRVALNIVGLDVEPILEAEAELRIAMWYNSVLELARRIAVFARTRRAVSEGLEPPVAEFKEALAFGRRFLINHVQAGDGLDDVRVYDLIGMLRDPKVFLEVSRENRKPPKEGKKDFITGFGHARLLMILEDFGITTQEDIDLIDPTVWGAQELADPVFKDIALWLAQKGSKDIIPRLRALLAEGYDEAELVLKYLSENEIEIDIDIAEETPEEVQ